jgi:DNA-binding PadR family transcriptional regulator
MGIAQQILADSLAKACPSRSTLYEELARLEQAALIESVESGAGRHSYRLTNRGRRVLENETKLLRMIVQTADGRLRY